MKQDNQANRREQPDCGFRKFTPGLKAAEQLAKQAQEATDALPHRYELRDAIHILLRAGKLTPALAQTMTTLIEMCGTWENEGVPIVFAGNRGIADRLGLGCQRSLRTRLAKLANIHQLICHEERPGGRRGVERDPITLEMTYFGISLMPLVAQLPAIKALGANLEALYARKAAAARKLRSCHQRVSRVVSAALEAKFSQRAWLARLDHANDVLEASQSASDASQLETFAETMHSAQVQAENSFDAEIAARTPIEAPSDVDKSSIQCTQDSGYGESGAPPETTNKSQTDKSVHCTQSDTRQQAYRPATPHTDPGKPGCFGLENKPYAETSRVKPKNSPKRAKAQHQIIEADLAKYHIGPDQLATVSEMMHACLPFSEADDPSWPGVYAAAVDLRPIIGLSEYAWRHAVETLGRHGAAALMAYATGSPEIRSAPGYIRRIADIAANGGILDLGQKLRKLSRLRDAAGLGKKETMQ